ncbi:MAG: DUF6596 domain-containing protein, partial [Gemmatimonadota bacterium]
MTEYAEEGEAQRIADAVARRSYGKLVAFLSARTRDVAAAEDVLSEAFVAALVDWPRNGCPSNPEAWLLTVARRKLIDSSRHQQRGENVAAQVELLTAGLDRTDEKAEIPDYRLGLMFACTHPAIDVGIRAPLMLQVVLGLNAQSIASTFLTSPSAMGKRLVRAKEKIRLAGVPLSIPGQEELSARLDTVLDAIYAAFTEGWSDQGGTDQGRDDLTGEAIFLARLVTELLPDEPEALGLLALILHAEARRPARRTAGGEYVPLALQDQVTWDWAMIREGETLLRRASRAGVIGRYQLEAAIQSAHVFRCRTGRTNWVEIVHLYDALLGIVETPVVRINRALAIAEVDGAILGLQAMPDASTDGRLREYQPYWAARADLLARAGESDSASHAYDMAIGLETDPAVRRFLERRRTELK